MEFIPFGSNWTRIGGKTGAAIAQPLNRAVDLLQHEKLQELERRSSIKNRNAEIENFVEQAKKYGMPESFINAAAPQRPEDRFKAMQFGPQFEQYKQLEDYKKAIRPLVDAYEQENQMAQHQRGPVPTGVPQGPMQSLMQNVQPGAAQQQQQSPTGAQSESDMQNEALQAAGMRPTAGRPQGSGNPYRDELERIEQLQRELIQNAYKTPTDKYRDQKLAMDEAKMQQRERIEQNKMNIRNQEAQAKHYEVIKKASEPYRKPAEESKKSIRDYAQLKDIALDGKARLGNEQALMEKLGFQQFGRNYSTQAAEKLISRLAQNIRSAFPEGRITNYLEQTYQKSLPSMLNTRMGVWLISSLNELADQANIIKDDIRQQVLRENDYNIPPDFDDQIINRAQPYIDELEQKAFALTRNPQPAYKEALYNYNVENKALKYPQYFAPGTEYIADNGKIYVNKGSKKWVETNKKAFAQGIKV